MKISFDFDSTLSELRIQLIAESLIQSGNDVWIVTSRYEDILDYLKNEIDLACFGQYDHSDLFKVATELGLEKKIIFTNFQDKADTLIENKFDMHFDDNADELIAINNKTNSITTFLVNPSTYDLGL